MALLTNARDAVLSYSNDVIDGRVAACQLNRLACERAVNDFEHGADRGLVWHENAARTALDFFQFVSHSKGEWAGQRLDLAPWQQFIVAQLFGWKNENTGLRRFRTSYATIARKNGKSTLAAGIGLKLLIADNEAGAEVYSAAMKRDQARITHQEAVRSVLRSDELRQVITVRRDNLIIEGTAAKYEPLGRDADSLEGLNPHGVIVDEIQSHKSRALWDVLQTAMGARRQPMIFAIGTGGSNQDGIGYEIHQDAERVLRGSVEDDAFFAFIAMLDDSDDWADESAWIKANPNLGVCPKREFLQRLCAQAKRLPSAQNAFVRLHCNRWTEQETRWLDMDTWHASGGAVPLRALLGRRCFGGLDLASRHDLTAFVLAFPRGDGGIDLLCRFWLPESAAAKYEHDANVPWSAWARAGYVTLTPGEVTDYDEIVRQVADDYRRFSLRSICYDPWNCEATAQQLAKRRISMVQFPQTIKNFTAPCKDMEALLLSRQLHHGHNPILAWCAQNVEVRMDHNGNMRPVKPDPKGPKKVDGIVAALMAVAQAKTQVDKVSIYAERGLREV